VEGSAEVFVLLPALRQNYVKKRNLLRLFGKAAVWYTPDKGPAAS